jgi:ABC-type multidrug transport system fused ATPase/permease subunit
MLAQPFSDPGRPDLRSPSRLLVWLVGAQIRTVLSGAVWGVAWMVAQAAIPALLGEAIEDVVRRDRGGLVMWSAVLFVLGVIQAVAGVLRHRRAVANFILATTRIEQVLARAVSRLGPRVTDQVAAGEVANLGGADVERIGELLDVSARFSGAVVSYIGVTVVLLVVSTRLGVVVALGAVVVVAAIAPLTRPLQRRQTAERDLRAASSSLAADTVVGLRILRGLGGEVVFADRFAASSQLVRAAAVRTARIQSYLDATQVVLPQTLVLGVTWLGAHLVLDRHLDPGQLVAVYAYAAFLVLPVQTFVEAFSRVSTARVAAGRVLTVLRLSDDIPAEATPTTGATVAAAVAAMVDAVAGPRADALVDPSTGLAAAIGRLTAVVTPTPEASAALVDRLGRWVDPAPSFTVTLAGTPLPDIPVAELRRRLLVVDRGATLLAGTLGELLDPQAGVGRVTIGAALDAAAATEIVDSLPEGLDTVMPERGRNLSGGQRQRVLLAQALLADPEILVLDEPTSAVDAHTEAAIGEGLADLRRGRTTVICTTSPLLLSRADVVVLVDGTVAATGTHVELLASSRRYRDVVTRGADMAVADTPGGDMDGADTPGGHVAGDDTAGADTAGDPGTDPGVADDDADRSPARPGR